MDFRIKKLQWKHNKKNTHLGKQYKKSLIGMDFLLQFKNIKFDFDAKTIEI